MEGGNNAVDPATGRADNVDDLMLLTTRVSPDGALLTTTGDTRLENEDDFHKRISKAAREEDEEVHTEKDDRQWDVGPQLRSKGSIHSDTWTGTAVELARCGVLAVYPVSGWWRERKHLNCGDRQARYALIVSIETPETDVYTSVANQIAVPTSVEIATE